MNKFLVAYDMTDGSVRSIINEADPHKMNFAEGAMHWGLIRDAIFPDGEGRQNLTEVARFLSCKEIEGGIEATYQTERFFITVTRRVVGDRFCETYRFKNITRAEVFVSRGQLGIYATFNENYDLAEVCLQNRCHTHIWCGGDVSFVEARKMGLCDFALGLALTEGSLDTYSVERDLKEWSNDRGDFILHASPFILPAGEETVISWELFWHEDGKFYEAFEKYERGIVIRSDAFTVFEDEEIRFEINRPDARVFLGGKEIPTVSGDGKTFVTYKPSALHEHIFAIEWKGIRTKAEFYVQTSFRELVKARVEFIVNKQQYHHAGSPIDGAYLIYDNEEERMYYDDQAGDHNACRERLVMGLLVAKYLQYYPDDKIYASMMKYYDFVSREFYDDEKGEVYNTIGRDPSRVRLYNGPWMGMFILEMYKLTHDKSFLKKMCKLFDVYYSIGGERFYPNGITMIETYDALKEAGMEDEAEAMLEKFKNHVGNIVKIGINYPPHEVKYEQTVVSPGLALVSQMALITKDPFYLPHAKLQAKMLERFCGEQPSFHFNQLSIRHWDAFWFGKRRLYGDTFPHVASIHSSDAFLQYADASGDEHYRDIAWRGMRNNLCCFREDGRAYSSYVYPFTINGEKGEYYDPWANEQDGALYFMIKYFGLLDK